MLYVNGRFLTQALSGVQRYAREMLGALDAHLTQMPEPAGPIEVLVPHPVETPDWSVLRTRVVRGGQGHLWEQTTLARAARGAPLLSLGNSGPVAHPNHLICLHDAHLFDIPEAFSPAYRLWHRALRPVLARRARALLTVSAHSARRLGHHLGVDPNRFDILSNSAEHVLTWPADTGVVAQRGLQRGRYLLSVGNQSPNKNIAALVRAHSDAGPDVPPLVIVGGAVPGVSREDVGQGRIHLLGRVPDADLRGLYEGAAGFVFPSLNEGFGIPPLEAMQLGVPVICARSGAMPEVLGDAPMWFDPRNPRDMTPALQRFSALPTAQRLAMIDKGHTVAARYTWYDSAVALLNVLVRVQGDFEGGDLEKHTVTA